MRTRISVCVAAVSFATLASAQQVIYFKHAVSPQALQEMANAIRSAGDIKDIAIDAVKKTLVVNGTAEQIALAQWLGGELDKDTAAQTFGKSQYVTSNGTGQGVEVFFLAHTKTPQEIQEAVNVVRSIADIQRFFPISQISAIVARGTSDQLAAAEWILGELDPPSSPMQVSAVHNHPMEVEPRQGNLAQVFFLPHAHSPQELQELVNVVRSLAELQRLFPVSARNAVVIRGEPEQLSLADWLLSELDKPAAPSPTSTWLEYPTLLDSRAGNLARLYIPAHAQVTQETIDAIRSSTKMQRVFYNPGRNAIAMRGTGDQIAQAQQLLKQIDN